ncbi:MAG: EamA family transporter [Lentisphaeria bacterium]|nr:EamA family transporter [Lentisphaeria bacterium]
MLLVGILTGLASALFMSVSYVFSRAFIRKHKDPVRLSIFSQFVLIFGGLAALGISLFFVRIPFSSGRFWGFLLGEVVFFLIGQTSFFLLLKKVEATRASSLLGLKLIPLALIASLLGQNLSFPQWFAVVLCALAAAGMNLTGLSMGLSSLLWLILAVVFYALCDICLGELVTLMPAEHVFLRSLAAIGACFTAMGLAASAALWKFRPAKRELLDVIPYSFAYFSSILLLLVCFGLLGVVFGNILQSGRGILSVLLGMILLRLGWEKTEEDVSKKVWGKRLLMAFLMLCAMLLYTLASARR